LTNVVVVALSLVGLGFLARLAVGPRASDRINAVCGLVVTATSATAVYAVDTGSVLMLDAVLVVGLVGFTGAAVAARFAERREG
jgi:multisubunit Na+/H+ antiporter MnhF subunit